MIRFLKWTTIVVAVMTPFLLGYIFIGAISVSGSLRRHYLAMGLIPLEICGLLWLFVFLRWAFKSTAPKE